LVAAYAAAILCMSSIPSSALPRSSLWDFDKVIHACEYGLLGAFVTRALWGSGRRSIAFALLGFAIAAAFGGLDELYQRTTPGRFSSLADVAADSIGAALGTVATWSILRRNADPQLRRQAPDHR
jgi:VanZ family protein